MEASASTAAGIRALRPPKPRVDPWRAIGHRWDVERGVRVERRPALTVFLAGAECPFTCLFCDLWRHTLDGPTPADALPRQLADALAGAGPAPGGDAPPAIKLYNASNFFEPRAVPPDADEAIARLCGGFERVTVECHPRLLGERARAFAARLDGRLEIAMGLETVHPDVYPRLGKGMTLDHFAEAVACARKWGLGTRAFVLVGLPWVPAREYAEWAARSVQFAGRLGVDRVSLIPLRTGNGALDALARDGDLEPMTLDILEEALERGLAAAPGEMIVDADLWDVERLGSCERCGPARVERLARMNLEQTLAPPVGCGCRA